VLSSLQASGAPATAITEAAQDLASAKSELSNLTNGPDAQAQIDQANARADAAVLENKVNAAALAAFGAPGDIGTGGRNAYGAASGVTVIQTNQMLHPADPKVLAAIAGAATAGIGAQGYVPNSKIRTGV
jgi:hypothetical protein